MSKTDPRRSGAAVLMNILKSFGLILLLAALVGVLGALIGSYGWNDPGKGLLIALGLCAVFIPIQMLMAKRTILAMTRGRPLGNSDQEQTVRRLTEALSRRAGFSRVPELYVTPAQEPNAFASGTSQKNAFIGVTGGLLQRLDEKELEGVLAHEISHIAHRDIMVSQLAVSLVSVILLLTSFLSRFLLYGRRRSSRDRDNGGGLFLLLGLLALVLQPVAMLISNLIQMAISRKREYAADAEGAALCGSPRGLASALAKISSASYTRQERQDLGGAQMQSMYIHYPKQSVQGLFSTHPPVSERIRLLRELEM